MVGGDEHPAGAHLAAAEPFDEPGDVVECVGACLGCLMWCLVTGGVDGVVVDDDGFVFAPQLVSFAGTEAHHLGIVGCGDVCFAPQQIPGEETGCGLSVGENGLAAREPR